MEIIRQKSIRAKNVSYKASIRHKKSFNKVRKVFEKPETAKFDENGSNASKPKKNACNELNNEGDNKASEGVNRAVEGFHIIRTDSSNNLYKKSGNLTKVPIFLKPEIPIISSRRVNESIEEETESEVNKVKAKINFFEEKTTETLKPKYLKRDKPKIDPLNYGNQDIEASSNSLDPISSKALDKHKESSLDVVKPECDSDLDYTLREKLNIVSKSERNSSISVSSIYSLSSDICSNESDGDVVLRNKTNINRLEVRPIPRERTSINKTNNEQMSRLSKDIEVNKLCQRVIRSNSKSLQTNNEVNVNRSSSRISQDSGIEISNNSYLWQNSINSHKEIESQIYKNNQNEEENEDHIYEELCNCRSNRNSVCDDDEWIDIGNDPKKYQIEIIIKKPQTIRPHIYRKSFKSKPHQRKSQLKPPANKTDISDNSGTEYEDIDDDDSVYSDSIYSDSHINSPPEISQKQIIDQHLSHIYDEVVLVGVDNKQTPQQNAFVKELSDRVIKRQNSWTQSEDSNLRKPLVRSSTSNIGIERANDYSSTPRFTPKFEVSKKFSIDEINSINTIKKRDSQFSRASSIYIQPPDHSFAYHYNNNNKRKSFDSADNKRILIPYSKVRAEVIHKQNSVTGSVASYLEFNSCHENSSPFISEPLYQFYQKDVRRRAELWIHADPDVSDLDYDLYESNSIYNDNSRNSVCQKRLSSTTIRSTNSSDNCQHISCKGYISALDLVGNGPNRSLWCQLPQVINSKSSLLKTLTEGEKRLQEAMFEIITSEASYWKSLKILVTHFNNCIELSENNPQILSLRERKSLFSNITEIYEISSKLLSDLEKRFEHNILLYDVCDILYDYAINKFTPYIRYCAYQRDQENVLLELMQSRKAFVDILQRLESNRICQNQNLLSFIMLPMQRITRYPLLVDAVCQQLPEESPIFESSRKALAVLNQLVRKCNEETKKVQRMQELIDIEKKLRFRNSVKSYPIVSGSRYLVKSGSVVMLSPEISPKKTIGRSTIKWSKSEIYLFLFSDLLIIAKKKSDNRYSVFDYCSRNTVQLISLSDIGGSIGCNLQIPIPQNYSILAQLVLLHNHEGKSVEHTLSFSLESERLRWIEAVSQPISDNPNEVIYEEWDCPQVQCIKSYSAKQTDELSLEETDVVNVHRKMKDGWFEGERIRDSAKGWFPSDCTEEIVNQHVRARNIRLRHRLLMYTQSFIKEQKRMSVSSFNKFI